MKKYIQISTWLVAETEKAFAVEFSNGRQGSGANEKVWFPKSQCTIIHPEDYADENRMLIDIPMWLAQKHVSSQYELGRFAGYCGIITK